MNLDETIMAMIERIRQDASCAADVQDLQGEVLQFRVVDGPDYRLAFRNHSVELDGQATPTFKIQGEREVFRSLFQGSLTPLAAIMTRRLKVTFDPERMPRVRRVIAAGMRQSSPGARETSPEGGA